MQNSIGDFSIGESFIGTQSKFYTNKILISQYANSPILCQLIVDLVTYFDQTGNIDSFFDTVWSIDTARGAALDIWGRIVGVQRILPVTIGLFFGFLEQGNYNVGNFSNSVFYNDQPTTSNYTLSDKVFRQLILVKAAFNLTDCTILSINQLLLNLFPNRGACYITDNLDMTMTYTFDFTLTAVEKTVVVNSGILPRPSGVAVLYNY